MSLGSFDFKEMMTAFMVLFAVIDITGSIPIILDLKQKSGKVHSGKAAIISFLLLVLFLFMGEGLLKFFNVDIPSFAIAGAIVLIALAIEMTFNITIFKNDAAEGSSTIVPLVFPLIAGAGSLTTCLSLRAECSTLNIILAIALNMLIVYIVIKKVDLMEKILGKGGIYILRKFFGIILLAMSVKLIVTNLSSLLN
ncbi:MAG: MarC family protein [Bacteroidales bacterium]|jgi:multiple antibiotic resistance protein|nr:MarC family protein [Bacteroidales bacterium]MBQ1192439.1 MarC family protein [Bacteroidales bacterium]MBQ2303301.1 MarC family protein [Bacteroidales bacterium]MBQ2386365.1 MarC family protein [Bacteroidales bacterium]MEE0895045.1 MarC family protein [Bacteroidales bacterium]